MREIKFRGESKDNGERVYGWYAQIGLTHYIITDKAKTVIREHLPTSTMERIGFEGFIEVIPATVGQYTGLKDKNGKEIYEGDIRGGKYYDNEQREISFLEKMVFENGCFKWERIFNSKPDFLQTEVISNIYENPELLSDNNK